MKNSTSLLLCATVLLSITGTSSGFGSTDSYPTDGDYVGFMENRMTYRVGDFDGEKHRDPDMYCELSDFGSWYDAAYSGGLNRFMINSARHHTYDQVGFNTTQDVALVGLFIEYGGNEIIDAFDDGGSVAWHPYGWTTTGSADAFEIESSVFFSNFDTITVTATIKNASPTTTVLAPSILLTSRSEYDGVTGGEITAAQNDGMLFWRNRRIGKSSDPRNYDDTLVVACSYGALKCRFLPEYFRTGSGAEFSKTFRDGKWTRALDSNVGAAIAQTNLIVLAPGQSVSLSFFIAAGADDDSAAKLAKAPRNDPVACSPLLAEGRIRKDLNDYLARLPKISAPDIETLRLYFSSALALRQNRMILARPKSDAVPGNVETEYDTADFAKIPADQAAYYSASCPARGGFNLFFHSDSCWHILGFLDIDPDWAQGHAVPVMVPPSVIMDTHFFWSMWELYSRLPDDARRQKFAEEIYPLLKQAYNYWKDTVDLDRNLLCSTPNNWDDAPHADLLFAESTDDGNWNSWWMDWVKKSRENYLETPSSSAQLGHGALVMGRLAATLGKPDEAAMWNKKFEDHVRAIDTLWDDKLGYWIVTYKHSLTDTVLTSAIDAPIFAGLCRDPQKIRRVIETHLLNPAEFNGPWPIPTVAYDDPRYYRQKPPRADQEGGLWRGNIWMPEAWIAARTLFEYGYESEAREIVARLDSMMAHQEKWTRDFPQFASVPAEFYDSRTGEGQHIRRLGWSCAMAMEFLLGNYENIRVVGANPERDTRIFGHVREISTFADDKIAFRVLTDGRAYPILDMRATDGLPIDKSARVNFSFADPDGNFANAEIRFAVDQSKWLVERGSGEVVNPDANGVFRTGIGEVLFLAPNK